MKPTKDRVLIKRDETKTMHGAIHIPDSAQKKTITGTVEAVGPHVIEVKPDDKVMFGEWVGTEILDEQFLLIREDDIMAVIDG